MYGTGSDEVFSRLCINMHNMKLYKEINKALQFEKHILGHIHKTSKDCEAQQNNRIIIIIKNLQNSMTPLTFLQVYLVPIS